jgi:P-type Ca2+ transporter type 2C
MASSTTSSNPLPEAIDSWHSLDIARSVELLDSDPDRGLSRSQVQDRQLRYGPNELEEKAGRSGLTIFIDQFKNIMLIMLGVVAVVSAVIDVIDREFPKDAVAITLIVVLNGILGYLQESQAEKALAALKAMTSPRVRLLRDGATLEIDAKELVPGDVILIEAGVQIPADGRLLETASLQIRESALTGEAEAVMKQEQGTLPEDSPLGDRLNLIYQGTEVVQGRAKAIVTRTGMKTELGKIATMLQDVEAEPTPLQQRMDNLGNVLVYSSLAIVALVVSVGMFDWSRMAFDFDRFKELLKVALSMAVAVVPEGLTAVITVTLALGTQRMVKRNALIRKLPAVETLGSVTTICSDKTGTLTQNKMVVQQVHSLNHSFQVSGEGYSPDGELKATRSNHDNPLETAEVQTLLMAGLLCNDGILQQNDQGQWTLMGDPTEGSLLPLAAKAGYNQEAWRSRMPRVSEIPFSSERKRMSVVCRMPGEVANSGHTLFTKGSAEMILELCTVVQSNDQRQALTPDHRQQILAQVEQMASQGLRVLGLAYRLIGDLPKPLESAEADLTWLGLVGILDAPRPEVRDAVARCRAAGIRPVMITGDHQLTARAIATDLGIAEAGAKVLDGKALSLMDAEELGNVVDEVSIYARVAPEHKLRIVEALQKRGRFVAMTGDGVNDAPALKQANIGIAMGITGTDVSKEASDMVLLDDNFATIVAATEEGRVVYTNIRRFIKYILGSNIGEVIAIAATPLLGFAGTPLTPLQILWMNLVTDGLPALALAVEPAEPNVMNRPPFNPKESIFSRGLGWYMVRIGIILGILTIVMMVIAVPYTKETADAALGLDAERWKTMVFTTLCLAQMGHAMAVRSNSQLTIELNPFTNPFLLGSVVLTSLLQMALIYVEPLRNFFGTHVLSLTDLGICFGFSALMFIWIEGEKLFLRMMGQSQD